MKKSQPLGSSGCAAGTAGANTPEVAAAGGHNVLICVPNTAPNAVEFRVQVASGSYEVELALV